SEDLDNRQLPELRTNGGSPVLGPPADRLRLRFAGVEHEPAHTLPEVVIGCGHRHLEDPHALLDEVKWNAEGGRLGIPLELRQAAPLSISERHSRVTIDDLPGANIPAQPVDRARIVDGERHGVGEGEVAAVEADDEREEQPGRQDADGREGSRCESERSGPKLEEAPERSGSADREGERGDRGELHDIPAEAVLEQTLHEETSSDQERDEESFADQKEQAGDAEREEQTEALKLPAHPPSRRSSEREWAKFEHGPGLRRCRADEEAMEAARDQDD